MGHYYAVMFPEGGKNATYYNAELPPGEWDSSLLLKVLRKEERKKREKWQIDVFDKQARHMWE